MSNTELLDGGLVLLGCHHVADFAAATYAQLYMRSPVHSLHYFCRLGDDAKPQMRWQPAALIASGM